MVEAQYRRTSHTTYDTKYHIVWGTKYRKKILRDDIGYRLRDIIRQICTTDKVEILKGSIGPDHVHLLLSIPPYMAVSRVIQHVKGESSRKLQLEFPHLKKRYWGEHLWAVGYFCATVGTVDQSMIQTNIEEQGRKQEGQDRTFVVIS